MLQSENTDAAFRATSQDLLIGNPLVSVIVPNYNYARFLRERIDSVLSQTYQNFELILLDDCSTDGSLEMMNEYATNPKVSHIVRNETNSGSPCRQWEKGLRLAKGKYAWIAEADDMADPRFLEECVAVMEDGPRMSWVGTMSRLIDAEGNLSPLPPMDDAQEDGAVSRSEGREFVLNRMLDRNPCYNASRMVFSLQRWKDLKKHDWINLRYVGDWLFWGLMAMDGNIGEIHKKLNHFRFHGQSVTDEGRQERETARGTEDLFVKDALGAALESEGYRLPDIFRYRMLRDIVYRPKPAIREEMERRFPAVVRKWEVIPKLTYRLLKIKKSIWLIG